MISCLAWCFTCTVSCVDFVCLCLRAGRYDPYQPALWQFNQSKQGFDVRVFANADWKFSTMNNLGDALVSTRSRVMFLPAGQTQPIPLQQLFPPDSPITPDFDWPGHDTLPASIDDRRQIASGGAAVNDPGKMHAYVLQL